MRVTSFLNTDLSDFNFFSDAHENIRSQGYNMTPCRLVVSNKVSDKFFHLFHIVTL
jgi:ferredoxin-thioredoxin reductase catalytic subunit